MDQLFSLLCACIKQTVMEDKDNDGVPDFMQRGQSRAGDILDHLTPISICQQALN